MARKSSAFIALSLQIFFFCFVQKSYALELSISGNGEQSSNEVQVTTQNQTTVQQTNTNQTTNSVAIDAQTGNNSASNNTAENTSIQTGDITIQQAIENSGTISTLQQQPCCETNSQAIITENGTQSHNSLIISQTNQNSIQTNQTTTITNFINGRAQTGNNSASNNEGNTTIKTGSISVSDSLHNGPLSIVSNQIHNSIPTFVVSITGNGNESTNTILLSQIQNTALSVTNRTDIFNAVIWDLSTGNNHADNNNGANTILTGSIFLAEQIKNGPINITTTTTNCCEEKPAEPTKNPPIGGEDPKTIPGTNTKSSDTSSHNSDSQGGSYSPNTLKGILPATGNAVLLYFLFGNIIMFFFGWYLRLRSGRSPGFLAA